MIDSQLLAIDNQFSKLNAINPMVRKEQIQKLLSKIIYDIYSLKMKNSIGFIIDFRESCDTIMKYIFRSNNAEKLGDYSETLLKTLNRLNDISKNNVSFNSEIKFERDIHFQDEFCSIVGGIILKSINTDFNWNLFFRILFEIELGNNAEDFENFIIFFRNSLYESINFAKLYSKFNCEEAGKIVNSLMVEVAQCFKKTDSIKFIYDKRIEEIRNILDNTINTIVDNINSYEQWDKEQNIYFNRISSEILTKLK